MNVNDSLRAEVISSLFGRALSVHSRGSASGQSLSVDDFHVSNILGIKGSARSFFLDVNNFFDPQFDYDFTNMSSSEDCSRGNEPYSRPLGWYRIALKVRGKYPDGDTWLGTDGWRSHSVPGEWPVSYHGTSLDGAKGIIREHFKTGVRGVYGRGIYSTPDISVAEREEYAQTFVSQTTGKTYKVILQNRINPSQRVICTRGDYWLIPVTAGTSEAEERRIVERSIRPYGILFKETQAADQASLCTIN